MRLPHLRERHLREGREVRPVHEVVLPALDVGAHGDELAEVVNPDHALVGKGQVIPFLKRGLPLLRIEGAVLL